MSSPNAKPGLATARLRLVFGLLAAGAILFGVRLFFLQVVHAEYYQALARRQYERVREDWNRGAVFFLQKDGARLSAAGVRSGYLAAIKPTAVKEPTAVYERLAGVLPLDREDFLAKAARTDDPYEEIAHGITEEKAATVRALNLPGVTLYPEAWRYYPGGRLASQVLGFVGWSGDVLAGRYGVEKVYDVFLSRRGGAGNTNSFFEIFLDAKRKFFTKEGRSGDVVLTLEPRVQSYLESELINLKERYKARSAGGLVIEPATGRLLAMASKPDFDPNSYAVSPDLSLFLNPHVQSVFEMGSIMKPLTLSAALDAGAVTPETEYNDLGTRTIDGRVISNFDGKARGRVNLQEVLNQSLNMGAVFIMEKMGKETFRRYFKDFGLGEKTGVELPDELAGIIGNLGSPRLVEYATASFGQGIAVTPLQMASALSALANGGVLMRPYVVERLEVPGESDEATLPEIRRRVLKEETSKTITQMLVAVVDKALLGGTEKLEHYSVAAKTGTAQVRGSNGYEEGEYLHTFFGYFPASAPRFLVFLYLERPQGVAYASHSLTTPFMDTAKFLINYYEISPDR